MVLARNGSLRPATAYALIDVEVVCVQRLRATDGSNAVGEAFSHAAGSFVHHQPVTNPDRPAVAQRVRAAVVPPVSASYNTTAKPASDHHSVARVQVQQIHPLVPESISNAPLDLHHQAIVPHQYPVLAGEQPHETGINGTGSVHTSAVTCQYRTFGATQRAEASAGTVATVLRADPVHAQPPVPITGAVSISVTMKSYPNHNSFRIGGSLAVLLFLWPLASFPATQTLYSTGFEAEENFQAGFELIGQDGWEGDAAGVNGVDAELAGAPGQQAYIGFFPPALDQSVAYVYRPIDFDPAEAPVVTFSTRMAIVDSTNEKYDNFSWEVYNADGAHLFTVDFDNFEASVSYFVAGTDQWIPTGHHFTNDVFFDFSIMMDFGSNHWSATLAGEEIIHNQPLTTTEDKLTLGDISAVWTLWDASAPGDNFLVFDDYTLTATTRPVAPATLEFRGVFNGDSILRLHGPDGKWFAIETSTDATAWQPLKTNLVVKGSFDYVHTGAASDPRRFYRARLVE